MQAKGDVQIKIANCAYDKVTLKDALYVPELRNNLISVAKIVDNEHEVTFKKEELSDHKGQQRWSENYREQNRWLILPV